MLKNIINSESSQLMDGSFLKEIGGSIFGQNLRKLSSNDKSLTTLDLRLEKLSIRKIEKLSKSLEYNDVLEVMLLNECDLNGEKMKILVDGLFVKKKYNGVLKSVDVSKNEIGEEGMKCLCEMITKCIGLKEVIIMDNNLSNSRAAEYLCDALLENTPIKEIHFGEKNLDAKGMKQLFEGLKFHQSLNCLYIENNGNLFGDLGANHFSRVLEYNQSLKMVDLTNNDIGEKGILKIAKHLEDNKSLKKLILQRNRIGDKGCEYLSKSLKHNKFLTYLVLSRNSITDLGIKNICEMLKVNHKLENINISHNQIGNIGAKDLSNVLPRNHTLNRIDISYNQIKQEGKSYLKNAFNTSITLTYLNLSDDERENYTFLQKIEGKRKEKKFID